MNSVRDQEYANRPPELAKWILESQNLSALSLGELLDRLNKCTLASQIPSLPIIDASQLCDLLTSLIVTILEQPNCQQHLFSIKRSFFQIGLILKLAIVNRDSGFKNHFKDIYGFILRGFPQIDAKVKLIKNVSPYFVSEMLYAKLRAIFFAVDFSESSVNSDIENDPLTSANPRLRTGSVPDDFFTPRHPARAAPSPAPMVTPTRATTPRSKFKAEERKILNGRVQDLSASVKGGVRHQTPIASEAKKGFNSLIVPLLLKNYISAVDVCNTVGFSSVNESLFLLLTDQLDSMCWNIFFDLRNLLDGSAWPTAEQTTKTSLAWVLQTLMIQMFVPVNSEGVKSSARSLEPFPSPLLYLVSSPRPTGCSPEMHHSMIETFYKLSVSMCIAVLRKMSKGDYYSADYVNQLVINWTCFLVTQFSYLKNNRYRLLADITPLLLLSYRSAVLSQQPENFISCSSNLFWSFNSGENLEIVNVQCEIQHVLISVAGFCIFMNSETQSPFLEGAVLRLQFLMDQLLRLENRDDEFYFSETDRMSIQKLLDILSAICCLLSSSCSDKTSLLNVLLTLKNNLIFKLLKMKITDSQQLSFNIWKQLTLSTDFLSPEDISLLFSSIETESTRIENLVSPSNLTNEIQTLHIALDVLNTLTNSLGHVRQGSSIVRDNTPPINKSPQFGLETQQNSSSPVQHPAEVESCSNGLSTSAAVYQAALHLCDTCCSSPDRDMTEVIRLCRRAKMNFRTIFKSPEGQRMIRDPFRFMYPSDCFNFLSNKIIPFILFHSTLKSFSDLCLAVAVGNDLHQIIRQELLHNVCMPMMSPECFMSALRRYTRFGLSQTKHVDVSPSGTHAPENSGIKMTVNSNSDIYDNQSYEWLFWICGAYVSAFGHNEVTSRVTRSLKMLSLTQQAAAVQNYIISKSWINIWNRENNYYFLKSIRKSDSVSSLHLPSIINFNFLTILDLLKKQTPLLLSFSSKIERLKYSTTTLKPIRANVDLIRNLLSFSETEELLEFVRSKISNPSSINISSLPANPSSADKIRFVLECSEIASLFIFLKIKTGLDDLSPSLLESRTIARLVVVLLSSLNFVLIRNGVKNVSCYLSTELISFAFCGSISTSALTQIRSQNYFDSFRNHQNKICKIVSNQIDIPQSHLVSYKSLLALTSWDDIENAPELSITRLHFSRTANGWLTMSVHFSNLDIPGILRTVNVATDTDKNSLIVINDPEEKQDKSQTERKTDEWGDGQFCTAAKQTDVPKEQDCCTPRGRLVSRKAWENTNNNINNNIYNNNNNSSQFRSIMNRSVSRTATPLQRAWWTSKFEDEESMEDVVKYLNTQLYSNSSDKLSDWKRRCVLGGRLVVSDSRLEQMFANDKNKNTILFDKDFEMLESEILRVIVEWCDRSVEKKTKTSFSRTVKESDLFSENGKKESSEMKALYLTWQIGEWIYDYYFGDLIFNENEFEAEIKIWGAAIDANSFSQNIPAGSIGASVFRNMSHSENLKTSKSDSVRDQIKKESQDDDANNDILFLANKILMILRIKKMRDEKIKGQKIEEIIKTVYSTVLIVDERLWTLPWESVWNCLPNDKFVPVLRSYDLPNVNVDNIDKIKNNLFNLRRLDELDTFYLINPDDDLPCCESLCAIFPELFSNNDHWDGSVGKSTYSADEVYELLTEKDLFLYCGHSGGEKILLPALSWQNLKSISVLLGCKSAAIRQEGGMSTLHRYLAAGSPLGIGVVWNTTDKDLDRWTASFFRSWLRLPNLQNKIKDKQKNPVVSLKSLPLSSSVGHSNAGCGIAAVDFIGTCVQIAKRDCRLPLLTGGAVVCLI